MKNILTITIKLLIITIIAGIVLGVVNAITKEPIAEQAIKEATEARQAVFPEAASFEELDVEIPEEYAIITGVYKALDDQGNDIGITAAVVTKGFNAGLNMTIGVGADGTIKGVMLGSHNETPGLGAKATEPKFQSQYTGKPYDEALNVVKSVPSSDYDIQAITSATITSNAVTQAANTVTAFYKQMAGGAQ